VEVGRRIRMVNGEGKKSRRVYIVEKSSQTEDGSSP
jgi:hypothetical protein